MFHKSMAENISARLQLDFSLQLVWKNCQVDVTMRKKELAIKYYAIKYYKEADGGTNWNLTVKIGIQNR